MRILISMPHDAPAWLYQHNWDIAERFTQAELMAHGVEIGLPSAVSLCAISAFCMVYLSASPKCLPDRWSGRMLRDEGYVRVK